MIPMYLVLPVTLLRCRLFIIFASTTVQRLVVPLGFGPRVLIGAMHVFMGTLRPILWPTCDRPEFPISESVSSVLLTVEFLHEIPIKVQEKVLKIQSLHSCTARSLRG